VYGFGAQAGNRGARARERASERERRERERDERERRERERESARARDTRIKCLEEYSVFENAKHLEELRGVGLGFQT
jgi:hypothetical protein